MASTHVDLTSLGFSRAFPMRAAAIIACPPTEIIDLDDSDRLYVGRVIDAARAAFRSLQDLLRHNVPMAPQDLFSISFTVCYRAEAIEDLLRRLADELFRCQVHLTALFNDCVPRVPEIRDLFYELHSWYQCGRDLEFILVHTAPIDQPEHAFYRPPPPAPAPPPSDDETAARAAEAAAVALVEATVAAERESVSRGRSRRQVHPPSRLDL